MYTENGGHGDKHQPAQPSDHLEPPAKQQSVTSQKTQVFTGLTMKISTLTLNNVTNFWRQLNPSCSVTVITFTKFPRIVKQYSVN
jgi:hypothetical protein